MYCMFNVLELYKELRDIRKDFIVFSKSFFMIISCFNFSFSWRFLVFQRFRVYVGDSSYLLIYMDLRFKVFYAIICRGKQIGFDLCFYLFGLVRVLEKCVERFKCVYDL